eukprot:UN23073
MRIKSQYRWCLTGTPFSTSLKDLYGQLAFIGMKEPLNSPKWWDEKEKEFTQGSDGPSKQCGSLLKVLNTCIMRHKKDQTFNGKPLVQLPKRHEQDVLLEMSTQELAQYEKVFEIARHKYDTFKAQGRLNSGTLALMAA